MAGYSRLAGKHMLLGMPLTVADVVGYSRLAGDEEDQALARLQTLRSELIDPAVAAHHGRVVNRTGDRAIIEFGSVGDAVRCAIDIQKGMIKRNAGLPEDRRIEFRIGIHLGDMVQDADGDIMGEGVNIAARLEGISAPGAICLSEDAYRHVKGRLEVAVTDLGPTRLKNVAEPLHAYSLDVGKPLQTSQAPFKSPKEAKKPAARALPAAAIVTLLGTGVMISWYFLAREQPTSPAMEKQQTAETNASTTEASRLSLVVLPFTNLSNDPSQDYFADGITENLTTDLSRIPRSFVIARNTAFTFKGKNTDVKQIGKELGVRYVLEGSVQRHQNRVRVNAQLIDATTGAHIWADRFEEDVADLFKLQDEVVARLANSLGYELIKAEANSRAGSKNPDTIDLELRGRALFLTRFQQGADYKDITQQARALFDQALAADPDNPDALAGSAFTYYVDYYYGWKLGSTDYEAKILGQADRAISLDPNNMQAYYVKNFYLNGTQRAKDGLRAADQGLAIDPNYAALYNARGYSKIILGRFEEAKADILKAMELSPRDPQMGLWRTNLADAEMGLGNYDEAIQQLQSAIDSGFRTSYPYRELAAAYALVGKTEEAKTALGEALKFTPNLSIQSVKRTNPVPAVLEGLRKAGLKEE
ncbi:MAG: adenylate/guanylate cyclase domain-containing protein [Aestuariivirga sp.]